MNADPNLLNLLRTLRASVGEGLNDHEFTWYARHTAPPSELGFGFLSFSAGLVLLSVPPQDLAAWYPVEGWIQAGKEQAARALARKYGLSLCEPPDAAPSALSPRGGAPAVHHHLELTNTLEAVVIAHPRYLKVRLLGSPVPGRYDWQPLSPVLLGPDLLSDLAVLYAG